MSIVRIVAITRVLNEADIIEAFVRHHASYVSHHIFLDNGSIDGTIDILRALAKEKLPLTVLQTNAVSYCEQTHWSALYDMAVRLRKADWVLCLDADEFVDDRNLPVPFATFLAAVPPAESLIKAPMVVYHNTASDAADQPIVPLRLTYRVGIIRAHKAIVRGHADRRVTIEAGGHDIQIDKQPIQPWIDPPGLRWAHFPERSPWQNLSKIVIGWSKALANGAESRERNHSHHYGGTFGWLTKDPSHIFKDANFFNHRHDTGSLIHDPIAYRGGSLRHTPPIDPQMRAVQVIADYVEQLATRHGTLLDRVPAAREETHQMNNEIRTLFGTAL